MSRANCIKLYEHIVETNGKPDTQYCLANFGAEGYDFCSRFYTELFPVRTPREILKMAKTAIKKLQKGK